MNTSKFEALQVAEGGVPRQRAVDGGESVLADRRQPRRARDPEGAAARAGDPAADPEGVREGAEEEAARARATRTSSSSRSSATSTSTRRSNGLKNKLETEITRRGLVIRLLTDGVLFDSGEAKIKPRALPLMEKIAGLLQVDDEHPINVEGHTDNVPIHSSQFRRTGSSRPLVPRASSRLLIADERAGGPARSGGLRPASSHSRRTAAHRGARATGASRSSSCESTTTPHPEPSEPRR